MHGGYDTCFFLHIFRMISKLDESFFKICMTQTVIFFVASIFLIYVSVTVSSENDISYCKMNKMNIPGKSIVWIPNDSFRTDHADGILCSRDRH